MKLAVLGNGNLTFDDLERCIPHCVKKIITDTEEALNVGLKCFCEKKNIALVTYEKNRGIFTA